jgi:hypothetical protein
MSKVSSFFNSSERVASLLVKITNQVIRSCKRFITDNGSLTIWNQVNYFTIELLINCLSQEREEIERKLTQCITLNGQYREAYLKIKNKKVLFDLMICLPALSPSPRLSRRPRSSVLVRSISLEGSTPSAPGYKTY